MAKPETEIPFSTIFLVASVIIMFAFVLNTCMHTLATKEERTGGNFRTPQLRTPSSGGKSSPAICPKARKACKPLQLSKKQMLEEVNRKWSAMYSAENWRQAESWEPSPSPSCESLNSVEIKRVSFRSVIKDVYYIESKEEMQQLEELQRMGYDVKISRPGPPSEQEQEKTPKSEEDCEFSDDNADGFAPKVSTLSRYG